MSRSAERIVSLLWLLLEAGAQGRSKNEIFSYLYTPLDTSQAAKERQFTRDKETLTSIGVPIQWQNNGPVGDVYLIDHDQLYLPELDLTDDEIRALHQARALWTRTPMEDAIHTALARMTARQPTTPPVVGAQLGAGESLLTDLVATAREQAPVKFQYRTVGQDAPIMRFVRPWAVLMAHQQWYLIGWDFQRKNERLFKLSRIESTSIEPMSSDAMADQETVSLRPADFEIAPWRQRLLTEQTTAQGEVWVHRSATTSLRVRADVVASRKDWDLLHFTYQHPLTAAAHIAALTTNARVDTRHGTALAQAVSDILTTVRDAHQEPTSWNIPSLRKVPKTRRRTSDREVIARRLGIVAVVNQHGGSVPREQLRHRFHITDATLTDDLQAMQFWGMPEIDFAGNQFEVDPTADPVEILNAELLAQPWQLSAPEALGLISGLSAVHTIPGITPAQSSAATSLEAKLRNAIGMVAPHVGSDDPIVHPDLSLGPDDEVAQTLHQAAQQHRVVSMSYYSDSSGTITTRSIEPHQLLYSAGYGYIKAWCRQSSSLRTFRIDRIGSATMTAEHFSQTDRLSNPDAITPDLPDDPLTVIIHVSHRFRDVISAYHPIATARVADGSIFAQLAFRSITTLMELLTNYSGHLIVVEPAALRAQIWTLTNDALTTAASSTR